MTILDSFTSKHEIHLPLRIKSKIRNDKCLFGKIIASLELFPGKYSFIARELGITKDTVVGAGTAYAFGLPWDRTGNNGRRPYLNQNSKQELILLINSRISNNDCPTMDELIGISHRLHIHQMLNALNIGMRLQLTKVIYETQPPFKEPEESSIRKLVNKLGFSI